MYQYEERRMLVDAQREQRDEAALLNKGSGRTDAACGGWRKERM